MASASTPTNGLFQSTPSGGKATNRREIGEPSPDVSIHAFRGEGDQRRRLRDGAFIRFQSTPSGGKGDPKQHAGSPATHGFNPRLPGGRRHQDNTSDNQPRAFQSTPSGGKATEPLQRRNLRPGVSIHAFRGEGDLSNMMIGSPQMCFNPRLPGGRRHRVVGWVCHWLQFQSTPSGGKATNRENGELFGSKFQSTPSGGKATR